MLFNLLCLNERLIRLFGGFLCLFALTLRIFKRVLCRLVVVHELIDLPAAHARQIVFFRDLPPFFLRQPKQRDELRIAQLAKYLALTPSVHADLVGGELLGNAHIVLRGAGLVPQRRVQIVQPFALRHQLLRLKQPLANIDDRREKNLLGILANHNDFRRDRVNVPRHFVHALFLLI